MAEVYRDASLRVAKLAGVQNEQAAAARAIMTRAVGLAAESADTGAYASSFGVTAEAGPNGVVDFVVYNDDPAAVIIEYGHMTPATKNSPGTFVPGKHVLRRAIG